MNNGLGLIERKIIKQVRRIEIGFFRRRITHPGENALGLILIFYILVFQFQFQTGTDDRFVLENNQLRLFVEYSVYALPPLSFLNSFLFRKALWKRTVSAVASFIMVWWMLILLFISWFVDVTLIRQTNNPDGQMIALYERKDSLSVTPGDNQRCRYRVRQHRVFPGILRNEARLEEEVCRFSGGSIPPHLQ
jgi:hypothetical protein